VNPNPGSEEQPHLTGYVVLISITAALGGFLFGFDSGVINGTVGALGEAFGSSSVGTGFSVASVLLGCAVGALFTGRLADRFGRRPMMVVAAIGFIISAWGSGISASTTEFILYRLLGGLAVGAASVLAPAYISEVAPAAYRGRLASLQQLAIVVGLFCAFLSNFALAQMSGGAREPFWFGFQTWRWMFWVEIVPALFYGIGAAMAPESPRYLVFVGKVQVAGVTLKRVLGIASVEQKIEEIRCSLHGEAKPRFSDLLGEGFLGLRHVVWLGIGLSVFQQFVGINVIFYYGEVLWTAAGFTEGNALLINVISGVINVGATLVAIALIDRIGRKPLLLIGSVGMALMLTAVMLAFSTGTADDSGQLILSRNAAIVSLVCVHAYIFFFAISWGPVVWVMLGEMFNNRIRGAAIGVAAGAQWTANFAITMTFPVMLTSIGLTGAYGFYALSAAASAFFVWFLLSETKGKELEEF
jgi:SP family sugar:H+ symporter-like MFS transporter